MKNRDGEKGGRIGEEEEKEAGARSKGWRGNRKGKRGKKGSVPSWDPNVPGNAHCRLGSFLLWECYQDLKGI